MHFDEVKRLARKCIADQIAELGSQRIKLEEKAQEALKKAAALGKEMHELERKYSDIATTPAEQSPFTTDSSTVARVQAVRALYPQMSLMEAKQIADQIKEIARKQSRLTVAQ